jgi:protein required for attachment to host cells
MTKEKTDPKKHASIAFAKEITERITNAKHDGTCRDFALIVAPRFLGVIRESLSTMGNAVPFLTIDKEVVGRDIAFIEKLLDAQL